MLPSKTQIGKLEFLRMLVKMELDLARKTLLTGFFETYLRLSAEEEKELEAAVRKMPTEKLEQLAEAIFELEKLEEAGLFISAGCRQGNG
ncbi:MAG: hypothetical protein GX825_08485 [Syntrophomonadaceae bacterium]|nr:hypothetical protein [Syntrophomonadaceae bacterium]